MTTTKETQTPKETASGSKRGSNRERILTAGVELFNRSGVVAVTTNHIADHLDISPGNLYFHFANKEEIIRELFARMCADFYAVWDPKNANGKRPEELIESTFDVFWRYRFFHREMYHMRRKDPILAKEWKTHLNKTMRQLVAAYRGWVKAGLMKRIEDPVELRMISDVVLITSSAFLQFYESLEKPGGRRHVRQGVDHVMRLLSPYASKRA